MHGGNVLVGPRGVGIGAMGFAAGDWFWPLATAGAGIYGGKALFESAMGLDTEQQKIRMFGMTNAQNQEAFNFAKSMRVYGSTEIENTRDFREALGVFRESSLPGSEALKAAKFAAPMLAKINALDSSLDEESQAKSRTSNLSMLRAVEAAGGLKSQAEFNRLANIFYKLKVSSGDTVDWRQLQQFEAIGGTAVMNQSPEGLARIEPSISTLGGRQAATALQTIHQRMTGTQRGLQVSVIKELLDQHVWDRSKVLLNKAGGIKQFLDPSGPMHGGFLKELTENSELFYEQRIRPIYERLHLAPEAVARQNSLLGSRTGGKLWNEWEKQLPTIAKASAAFNITKGVDAGTAQLPESLAGQLREFTSAWTDFKTDFGTSMLPFFTEILKVGSSVLRVIPNVGSNIGGGVYDLFHHAYDPNAKQPSVGQHLGTNPAFAGVTTTPIVMKVNEKTLGEITLRYTGKILRTGDQTSIGSYDPARGVIPSGGP